MKKQFIKNRNRQKIAVLVDQPENSVGLAFVMHGLGGFIEQNHIRVFAEAFYEKGFTVVRFDTTGGLGESDGDYADVTATSSLHDLKDVIAWAKDQLWYMEPFCLAGHSLGSLCAILYAQEHPEEVRAIAPTAAVISGKLTLQRSSPERLKEWDETGWKIDKSFSKPGGTKKLKWHPFKKDILQYSVLENASKLTMPALFIVGENDSGTPPEDQRLLYDSVPGPKDFHVIKNAGHTFRKKEHLDEVKNIMKAWIDSLMN